MKTANLAPARDTAPFWQSGDGRLIIPHCDACDEAFYYPRVLCPFCGSNNISWMGCKGTGTIYSVSVFRRADPAYALAYVTLDEGPRMMTNIVDCDLDAVRIGDRVRVTFKEVAGVPTPMFRPDTD